MRQVCLNTQHTGRLSTTMHPHAPGAHPGGHPGLILGRLGLTQGLTLGLTLDLQLGLPLRLTPGHLGLIRSTPGTGTRMFEGDG